MADIRLINSRYSVNTLGGDHTIYAVVDNDGKITLLRGMGTGWKENDEKEFIFDQSDPETVKAIGELIIAASQIKLGDQY